MSMEEDLTICLNGRQPKLFINERQTQFTFKRKTTSIIITIRKRPHNSFKWNPIPFIRKLLLPALKFMDDGHFSAVASQP